MYGTRDCVAVSPADRICYDNICAQRNADENIKQQADDRSVCADGCDRRDRISLSEIADNGYIRGIKQLPENAGGGNRQRITQYFIPHRTVKYIDRKASFSFFHTNTSHSAKLQQNTMIL